MQQIGWISPISSCKITKFLAKMFKGTRKNIFYSVKSLIVWTMARCYNVRDSKSFMYKEEVKT